MDVDVINILNDAFNVCSIISNSHFFDDLDYSLDDILKYDLINFIKIISKNNEDERIINFTDLYFKEKQIKSVSLSSPITSISLPLFAFYDSKKNCDTNKVIIKMFMIIGKHFMFSKFDKNDIDRDNFTNFMSEISNYMTYYDNQSINKNNEKDVAQIKTGVISNQKQQNIDDTKNVNEKSLQELLDDLNGLVGLDRVKMEVKKRINQIQVDKRREKAGFKKSAMSLHLVFTGNPGTGKTTVARKLAAIYKQLGILSQGQLVEVDRSGLVGSYVGSTALKTQEVINKAIGGILFIDEAYTLSYGKSDNDFGQESIDTLLKAMEDKREDLVVIVAGYTDEMHEFIKSNPGLESRFNKYIEFDDYTSLELFEIFKLICKNDEKNIHEECDAYLKSYFEEMVATKTSSFANGRTVRNYYEKVIENLNERLIENLDQIADEDLQLIRLSDLKA